MPLRHTFNSITFSNYNMSTEHNEQKLTHKLVSSLIYLHSITELKDDEELVISIKKDRIAVSRNVEELLNPKVLTAEEYTINPIKDMLEHINEEMCTDCLKFDSYFKDDFFSSLVRAYVDSLVHEYGLDVPITPELALAIVQYKVSDYDVVYIPQTTSAYLRHFYTLTSDNYLSLGRLNNYVFYLKAR